MFQVKVPMSTSQSNRYVCLPEQHTEAAIAECRNRTVASAKWVLKHDETSEEIDTEQVDVGQG